MADRDFDNELHAHESMDNPAKHILLLYDYEESLTNLLQASQEVTDKNWLRVCCGSESHPAIKFLKKNGWSDMTLSPYARLLHDTKRYVGEVWQQIIDRARETRTCTFGFMTGDICHQSSLENALQVEELYNSNMINGVMYCPYLLNDLLPNGVNTILELVKQHDQSFLVQKDKLYKIG